MVWKENTDLRMLFKFPHSSKWQSPIRPQRENLVEGNAAQQCWPKFEPLIAILTHSFLRITPFCLDVGTCWTFLSPHYPWGNHFSLYQLTGPTHARQPSSYPKPKFPLKFSKSFIRYHLRALLIWHHSYSTVVLDVGMRALEWVDTDWHLMLIYLSAELAIKV